MRKKLKKKSTEELFSAIEQAIINGDYYACFMGLVRLVTDTKHNTSQQIRPVLSLEHKCTNISLMSE